MISALLAFIVRVMLTVITVVFVLTLMAVAVVTMLVVIVLSLLRGKKPTIDVSGFKRAQQFRAGRGRPQSPAKPAGEVIDVEAREVPPEAKRTE